MLYFILPHSQPYTERSLTTLYALFVPACAVLLLLVVGAVIAICVKRRRRRKHSVAAKSLDTIIMKSTDLDIEQGFMDKLRGS